jgi:hypothetical protein
MTAEIAILNQFGVALAADSAVSIGDKKVYNSANKLFALSRKHPVGIMIYGNAKFMNASWEVLIKHFRKNILKEKSFGTLDEYCNRFLKFLATTALIPKANDADFAMLIASNSAAQVYSKVEKSIHEHLKANSNISKRRSLLIARKEIDGWIDDELRVQKNHWGKANLSTAQITKVKKEQKSLVTKVVGAIFSKLAIDSGRQAKVTDLILGRLCHHNFSQNHRSGVVISGYGNDDLYPGARSFTISGRVSGHLRLGETDKTIIDLSNRAVVIPFAQREMVDTFISGIDPDFRRAIAENISKSLKKAPIELLANCGVKLTAAQESALSSGLDGEAKKFTQAIREVQQQNFAQPVLSSVSALPIDELASMAEALVSLTSFKRKVTMVPESVGGPVDVAVISKGDGFIWIKRKHYFKAELNHQYFQNLSFT